MLYSPATQRFYSDAFIKLFHTYFTVDGLIARLIGISTTKKHIKFSRAPLKFKFKLPCQTSSETNRQLQVVTGQLTSASNF